MQTQHRKSLLEGERGDLSKLPQMSCAPVPKHPSRDCPTSLPPSEVPNMGRDGWETAASVGKALHGFTLLKIQPPHYDPEAASSCRGAYGWYRDDAELVPQVKRRQATGLEPPLQLAGIRAQPRTCWGPTCTLSVVPAAPYSRPRRTIRWPPPMWGAPSVSHPPRV